MAARENSAPRDRRGRSEAGDAYVLWESSCGESGTRVAKLAGLGMPESREGICKDRPLERNSGLLGVFGLDTMVWSSFEVRAGSRNFGDGDSCGVESDNERAFEDDLTGVLTVYSAAEGASLPVILAAAACDDRWLANWLPIIASMDGGGKSGPESNPGVCVEVEKGSEESIAAVS